MNRINVGRAIVGGLVAGVVANALDYVTARYLLVEENAEMAARLNLSAVTVDSSMTTWIVVDFLWGLTLVFTYAAMRPRFGPGPKTAAISGATMWFAVAVMFAGLTAMGVFTQAAFLKNTACYLISALAASLAGAAIYKEE